MAQAQLVRKDQESREIMEEDQPTSNNERSRLNAEAPEFVPRLAAPITTPVPVTGYFYPCFHILEGSSSSSCSSPSAADWFYMNEDQNELQASPNYWVTSHNKNRKSNTNNVTLLPNSSSNVVIPDDLKHKIIKQVEYQFSDISLLANETLAKHISKDPEGYVPISAIASTKKIKSLTSNNSMLAEVLRCSAKLIVSDDGKRVKRKSPFTDRSKEELQARTIVAENLPEDHSHQNLEKIFRVAGSVKTVRVCHPQESNSARPKGDFFISNKLHGLIEYESTESAERAVEKLNDERNWRKGLRVRLLQRCSPKSVLKIRRSEFDGSTDDNDTPRSDFSDDAFHSGHTSADENSPGAKKVWGRIRGKARGGRGPTLQADSSPRNSPKGPRMPDGTRGFAFGRGKGFLN